MRQEWGLSHTVLSEGWPCVELPFGDNATAALVWAITLPSEGIFYRLIRTNFESINSPIINCFYFNQQEDAMMFALRWGAA